MRLVIVGGSDAGISAGLSAHELARHIQAGLAARGVQVQTGTAVKAIGRGGDRLRLNCSDGTVRDTDLVLVVTGVRPDTGLAADAGITLGIRGTIAVDARMRTSLPDVYAAGDCVHTHHRLLPDPTYLPLGTTAHKQGRVAGTNAVGGEATFAGILGTAQAWTRATRRPLAS
jgi:NADPH-dependent 2,4-dienoyl-CoA reductase/sulfur reductase-like enzyme